MVVKATRPTVTTAQYGPNVAATEFSYYDTAGRLRWLKDAEGRRVQGCTTGGP
jgi:hypothetical protein